MKLSFILFSIFCCLPYLVQSQITRQETDNKNKNKTIVYKVEGSSDLDILNQLDPDVEIGQEIQIAWEKPKQIQAKPEKVQPIPQKKIESPVQAITPPSPTIKAPTTANTPRNTSSSTVKAPKVVAMSSKKRRKKKSFKVFTKAPKKQKRRKQNKKKCYKF